MRAVVLTLTTSLLSVAWWRPCAAADDDSLFERLESGRPPRAVVDKLESAFLSSFGMRRRPTAPARIPDYLRELYSQVAPVTRELNTLDLNLPGRLTGTANTVHSFVHTESKVSPNKYPANLQRLWFNTSSVPAEEALTAAELCLWWYSAVQQRSAPKSRTVQVYDIVRRTSADGRPVLRLVDVVHVSGRGPARQVTLDVRPAVQRWLARPQANHGLLVRVVGASPADGQLAMLSRPSVEEDADGAEWERRQPLLVAYTDDGRPRSRVRRRAGGAGKRRSEECQRRRLYVDFAEVGWNNWIVAPPGYDAYFCHGECSRFPMPAHLNATNHAIVQTLVSRKGSNVPPPCCIATEMSSISMLYNNDHGQVELKNYQDMVVEHCGCR